MFVLLPIRWALPVIEACESAEEGIDDSARVQEVPQGGQRARPRRGTTGLRGRCRIAWLQVKVGPIRRDKGSCSVGQDENQVDATGAVGKTHDIERLARQRVALADDADMRWKILDVGSVSYLPSTG